MSINNYNTKTKQFGDLVPGDQLIGANGVPVEVTDVYQKHIPQSMYEIEMMDGEVVRASGNHLWYCETSVDEKYKEDYREMARAFFSTHEIPSKLMEDEYFPLQDMIQIFGDEINVVLFIELACKSLGYSVYTPHLMYDDKMKVAGKKEAVLMYSYNDLIDFLHQMKMVVLESKGYFYFGQVRTTDEIAELMSKGMSINIPHKKDIIEETKLDGFTPMKH